MRLNPALRDMIGDALADAVDAARERLDDDTVTVLCAQGLWTVLVSADPVAAGLTYAEAITATEAL